MEFKCIFTPSELAEHVNRPMENEGWLRMRVHDSLVIATTCNHFSLNCGTPNQIYTGD